MYIELNQICSSLGIKTNHTQTVLLVDKDFHKAADNRFHPLSKNLNSRDILKKNDTF